MLPKVFHGGVPDPLRLRLPLHPAQQRWYDLREWHSRMLPKDCLWVGPPPRLGPGVPAEPKARQEHGTGSPG